MAKWKFLIQLTCYEVVHYSVGAFICIDCACYVAHQSAWSGVLRH